MSADAEFNLPLEPGEVELRLRYHPVSRRVRVLSSSDDHDLLLVTLERGGSALKRQLTEPAQSRLVLPSGGH